MDEASGVTTELIEIEVDDIWLAAAYRCFGGEFCLNKVDYTDPRRVIIVIKIDPKIREQVFNDWLSNGDEKREYPANVLRRFKTSVEEVRSLIRQRF